MKSIIDYLYQFDMVNSLSINEQPLQLSSLMKQKLRKEIYELLYRIGKTADEMKMNVYIVGGFVRDLILQLYNLDIDIVVEGDGIAFAERLAQLENGKLRLHRQFGTAVVTLANKFKIDVATARTERYPQPGVLPVVEPGMIKDDLFRRDFTINCMAIQLNTKKFGNLVDYFNGAGDLKLKLIRVLHNSSFIDDPTRMLRAVRFEQRYQFKLEEHTELLLKQAIESQVISRVSVQRIRNELVLMLEEKNPLPALKRLELLGILSVFPPQPRINPMVELSFQRISQTLSWFNDLGVGIKIEPWIVYLLGWLTTLTEEQKILFVRNFLFKKKVIQIIEYTNKYLKLTQSKLSTARQLKNYYIYNLLSSLPIEVILYLVVSSYSNRVRERVTLFLTTSRKIKPEITGRELQKFGVPPGPIYKEILDKIFIARVNGEVKNKNEEIQYLRKLLIKKKFIDT